LFKPTPPSSSAVGQITAARRVVLSGASIDYGISFIGGGGGVNCNYHSVFGGPAYSDIEDTEIRGSVAVVGLQTCWFGMYRNFIDEGSAFIIGNRFADPDANEIQMNHILFGLGCYANSPAAQVGDGPHGPNIVGGRKAGECRNL
jgi:hypothetical protein